MCFVTIKTSFTRINVISDKSDQNLTNSGHNNGCWSPLNRAKASQVNLLIFTAFTNWIKN